MITIATLRAAGLSDSEILRIIELDQNERLEKEREQSKIRSRNYRERHRVTAITRDARDDRDGASLLPSTAINNLTVVQQKKVEIGALEGEFAEFYAAYPHKVGKRAAVAAFERARRRIPMAEIMAGLARYAGKTDDRPWCNPATWLNQDQCHDQPGPAQEGNGHGRRGQPAPKDDPKSIRGAFDRLFARLDGGDEIGEPSRQANLRLIPGGSG